MQIKEIHQFSPACGIGDGITNGMFFTQRLLRELGFASEIYSTDIPAGLAHQVRLLRTLDPSSDQLMLFHFSLGFDQVEWLDQISMPKILVYHNITPAALLPAEGNLRRLAKLGRQQLLQWTSRFSGAIGDSEYNSKELREAGYKNVQTIPLLVDCDKVCAAPYDGSIWQDLDDSINLLFVGRICENKHQLDLLDVLYEYLHLADQPVRLILAGGITSSDYLNKIQARIKELGLENNVMLTGKIPDSQLLGLYRQADAFISLSEHEGFGMPLIEAMLFDVPVLAHSVSSIPDTLGGGGLLLTENNPSQMAALLHLLFSEPSLKRRVIQAQRANLQRFTSINVRVQLAQYLAQYFPGAESEPALEHAAELPQLSDHPRWQVEGPFDSSYSLAIVNRELAKALSLAGANVSLRSLEGGLDTVPDADFLASDQLAENLYKKSFEAGQIQISLRFCYPPRLSNMTGEIRVVHSYGWEETGFPTRYVNAFNRKLDAITVLSTFVEKVLRDNGVRIPISVTGGGVDHLLQVAPQAPQHKLKSYRLLHLSSCFPRKGVDALLAAYGQAFSARDDVTLVIKTFPNPHNTVPSQLAALRRNDPDYPDVVVINEEYSQEQLVGLYQACHVFVAPSRGEGLGLPMAEAMLFNLPVITTAWGGQLDFCDASTAWLCDYRFAKADTHLATGHSVWADPDVDDLAQKIREVYALHPEQRILRTEAARQRILRDYTWASVAQRVQATVRALEQQDMWRIEPQIGWISTLNTRCGIASYSTFLTSAIPSDRITVLANRTSERTAADSPNVVRCWNQQRTETMDDAYAEIIARGIQTVVIQYNFGFFSLQTLGQLIQNLKQSSIAVLCFFHATAEFEMDDCTYSLQEIAKPLALCDRLVVHGIDDLNRLKSYGLVHNVTLFPQGVLPTPIRCLTVARQEQGLQGRTVIAAYGFLLPHKGISALIEAFSQLVAKDKSLHLLLVTALYPAQQSENEVNACRALVDKLSLKKRISFHTDFLSDADSLAYLQAADLIVYPYQATKESSSAAVRMGLASGRPVAVTPLTIFEDVADAVHILPGTDATAIAEGVSWILDNPEAIRAKNLEAQQWVESRQWPQLSVRVLGLIDGLANPLQV
ncbi:MAG: glycosyltransferase [Burkholderiaceae bacterium]